MDSKRLVNESQNTIVTVDAVDSKAPSCPARAAWRRADGPLREQPAQAKAPDRMTLRRERAKLDTERQSRSAMEATRVSGVR